MGWSSFAERNRRTTNEQPATRPPTGSRSTSKAGSSGHRAANARSSRAARDRGYPAALGAPAGR